MWQETKHGLYKQFNFDDFKHAWLFMQKVAELAEELQHHPRWENEWSVVQIWLITHDEGQKITDKDREIQGQDRGQKRQRRSQAAIAPINAAISPVPPLS